jgi:predicted membrane protein
MKKIVIGVIIVLLGIVMLFKNTGLLPYFIYDVIISWQTLLIAIGTVLSFDKKAHSRNAGVVLILIGFIFLLPELFCIDLSRVLVPLLIIAGGIFFIINSVTGKNHKVSFFEHSRRHRKHSDEMPFVDSSISDEEVIRRDYVFTGVKERWTYGKIKKAEITAVFSGVELDFTQAELSDEVSKIVIHVSSVFGGVILYVPTEWNILVQKTGVFGSFADNRPYDVKQSVFGKSVILDLEAVFGGGEIKCYE